MAIDPSVVVGTARLKNPVIAGAAEHLIEADGIRRALRSGVGAVVVKSNNEVAASKDQLERSEYALLDAGWNTVPWGPDAPRETTLACRSGMSPMGFDPWLEQTAALDREARDHDSYVVASLILGALGPAIAMARKIEQAGIRVMEFNIGVPYGSQTQKGNVATEFSTDRVREQVAAIRDAVSIPVWVKTSGQSERVPDLAASAFEAKADAVIMAGRLLGFLPDTETMKPLLGSSLGIGGFWHLPITCHWLAMTRKKLGPDRPLIGINGAQSGQDVARMMLSGATAVEIASAVMYRGFDLLDDAVAEVTAWLERADLDAEAVIGRAADQHKTFMEMPQFPGNWRNHVPAEALGAEAKAQ